MGQLLVAHLVLSDFTLVPVSLVFDPGGKQKIPDYRELIVWAYLSFGLLAPVVPYFSELFTSIIVTIRFIIKCIVGDSQASWLVSHGQEYGVAQPFSEDAVVLPFFAPAYFVSINRSGKG